MLAWVMAALMSLVFLSGITGMTSEPAPTAHHAPDNVNEDAEWDAFHAEAYAEYAAEFTTLFNGYETRWSKNNRLMIRNGDSGPYRFVKRAV